MALRSTSLSDGLSPYAGRRMSETDYLALPEEKPYLEYVDGVVTPKAMRDDNHSDLAVELIFLLRSFAAIHGGRVGTEKRSLLRPQRDYRLPDVEFISPGQPHGDDIIPTLAIEVRSKSETMASQRRKCEAFLVAGAREAWLVDGGARTVQIFGDDPRILRGDEVLRSPVLPTFELPLTELFSVLDS
jgi:Uma2 family endonuclease